MADETKKTSRYEEEIPEFDRTKLKNADLNISQYGDDSSAKYYEDPTLWGGENAKYEGEGVKNTLTGYNPDVTLDTLGTYKYGQAAQMANSEQANYITNRNDQVASALYNAGLTSRDDVANYLSGQEGWNYSTEDERQNTINSIWKRLGSIASENDKSDTQDNEKDKQADAVARMESDLSNNGGVIYGKVTGEKGNPVNGIETAVDENAVLNTMTANRVANVKSLMGMDSKAVAYVINDGASPFSEQTMRDLQEFYPEKYQDIQAELKKIRGQDIVNQISEHGSADLTSQLEAGENNVTTSMNNFVNKTASGSGAGQLATNLNNALAESEIVSSSREQMEVYKRKIVDIQQSIDELPSLANSYFKGDVPQYVVNAFINNRLQQYQSELERYQNLYNASLDEAKLEISQTQWREEMNYKRANLESDNNYKNANLELSRQELEYNRQKATISNGQWNDDGSYSYVDLDGTLHTLSATEAQKALNQELYNKSTAYIDYWKNALETASANGKYIYGGQCEEMSDNYARQNYGTEMKKADGSAGATTVDEKARYATEALPQRGYIAVFDFKKVQADGKNYGHTGIVIDYDPVTGDFTTLESNAKKDKYGNPIVTIQTRNINSANLLGFWDPTVAEPRNGNGGVTPSWSYYDYPNDMFQVFSEASEFAKKRGGVSMVDDVQKASRAYGMLNNMNKNGEIEEVISDPEIATALQEFSDFINGQRFLQNAYLNGLTDEDNNFIAQTVIQYMMNSGQLGITSKKKQALDDLVGLVQIKLRGDSGAAINPSEWNTDFGRYLPQIGMSPRENLKRIRNLEVDASSSLLPIDYQAKYVPIISDEMIDAASDKVQNKEEELREETKNLFLSNK